MTRSKASPFRRFFFELGPGLITGAADDDPSGIATYSVAGARFGYAPLWTALFCFPLMVAMQLMCARLGRVTGRGLAAIVRIMEVIETRQFASTRGVHMDTEMPDSEPPAAQGSGPEHNKDYQDMIVVIWIIAPPWNL